MRLSRTLAAAAAAAAALLLSSCTSDEPPATAGTAKPTTSSTALDLYAAYEAANPWPVLEQIEDSGMEETASVEKLNANLDLADGVRILEADLGGRLPRLCVTGPDRSINMITTSAGDVDHHGGGSEQCATANTALATATLVYGPNDTLSASTFDDSREAAALVETLNPVAEKYSAGGRDAAVKADLNSVAAAMESYYADHNTYPRTSKALTGIDPVRLSAGTVVELAVTAGGEAYCLRGHNPDSGWPNEAPAYYPSDEGELAPVATGVCADDSLRFNELPER